MLCNIYDVIKSRKKVLKVKEKELKLKEYLFPHLILQKKINKQ